MRPLRTAILGCGGIGTRHAAALALLPERFELVACCGRDGPRTEAFAAERGVPAHTSLDALLGQARPDLVIVALPPFAHDGQVERIAAAGCHLLVEKPLALDLPHAQRMVEAASAACVVAANGFMYRFGAAVEAWQAADAGRVGMMSAVFQCNHLHAPWWRREACSGGQLLEQAIHLIDLVRVFMGEPDSVIARRARLFHTEPGYDIEDVSVVIFHWDDGRIATLTANNIAVQGVWHKEWSLFAERMTGRFSGWNDAAFMPSGGGTAHSVAGKNDPFVDQLVDLADAIEEGRAPRVPLQEGLRTLRLALAARQAADERRELALPHD